MFSLYFLSPDDIVGHIILFTISMACDEVGKAGGYFFAYTEVAGPFSASLFGFGNTLCIIPGFVNPLLVAYLTPNVRKFKYLYDNLIFFKVLEKYITWKFIAFDLIFREHETNG